MGSEVRLTLSKIDKEFKKFLKDPSKGTSGCSLVEFNGYDVAVIIEDGEKLDKWIGSIMKGDKVKMDDKGGEAEEYGLCVSFFDDVFCVNGHRYGAFIFLCKDQILDSDDPFPFFMSGLVHEMTHCASFYLAQTQGAKNINVTNSYLDRSREDFNEVLCMTVDYLIEEYFKLNQTNPFMRFLTAKYMSKQL